MREGCDFRGLGGLVDVTRLARRPTVDIRGRFTAHSGIICFHGIWRAGQARLYREREAASFACNGN
jgi:hypothetical protein